MYRVELYQCIFSASGRAQKVNDDSDILLPALPVNVYVCLRGWCSMI